MPGSALSLNIVFAVIAGGHLGHARARPSAPSSRRCWPRGLRVVIQGSATLQEPFGNSALALDQMIYGLLLVLFIIYMPKGILGTGTDWWRRWRKRKAKSLA